LASGPPPPTPKPPIPNPQSPLQNKKIKKYILYIYNIFFIHKYFLIYEKKLLKSHSKCW